MAVKIRLRRTGRKKQPSYRIVVAESTTPREGAYLDSVGTYNPLTNPAELRVDLAKVDEWLGRGAELTPTVRSLINKARKGGDATVALKAADGAPGRLAAARQEGERAAKGAGAASPAAEAAAAPAASGETGDAGEAGGAEPAEA
jgi:small subunit ribosomal protein S16